MTQSVRDRGTASHDRWTYTHAHARSVLLATGGLLGAVLLQRSDVVVLVAPFLVVALWSVATMPRRAPQRRLRLDQRTVVEGLPVPLAADVTKVRGMDTVFSFVADADRVAASLPRAQARSVEDLTDGSDERIQVEVTATRWGTRRLGPILVGGASSWGAFRWGLVALPTLDLPVLPRSAGFDTGAPAPHPRGLVGLHRSVRPGEGTEFATIRPFQWGDRLKRIHWSRSLRSGQLHVTSNYADHDTHCALIIDAHYDMGRSGGVFGTASSLDATVRAGVAVAEHFLHHGDRVSLQIWSARTPARVPPGSGGRHQRRIVETIAMTQPAPQEVIDPARLRLGMREGTLVVLVSALVSPLALATAASLASRGLSVVVLDVLDPLVPPEGTEDPLDVLAWRLRMLEREQEVRQIQHRGVPVVPWHGPGSLDHVLRHLARRA